MKEQIAKWLREKADHISPPKPIENTEPSPESLKRAVRAVQSIMSYVEKDFEKYQNIDVATMEYDLLTEKERSLAFFYVLGLFFELLQAYNG